MRLHVLRHHVTAQVSLCDTINASATPLAQDNAAAPIQHCASTGPIRVAEEVQHALRNARPVVALESTIISHGMPYPDNLTTALAVEQVVRDAGAVPATIAILDGVPCVGLSREQLTRCACLLLLHDAHRTTGLPKNPMFERRHAATLPTLWPRSSTEQPRCLQPWCWRTVLASPSLSLAV